MSKVQPATRWDSRCESATPAAAAILALDTEIDWIEDHSLDVYRGS